MADLLLYIEEYMNVRKATKPPEIGTSVIWEGRRWTVKQIGENILYLEGGIDH